MRPTALCAALLLQCSLALACGHCIEDKIASVYDYAVVSSAGTAHHQVAFFAIDGTLATTDRQRQDIERTVRRSRGVDPGTVRVSIESAALSFAFDPARISTRALQQSLQPGLALKGLSLQLLRVMDAPAEFAPTSAP